MYFDLSTLAETVAVDEGMIDNIKNKVTDVRDKYRKAQHANITRFDNGDSTTRPANVLNVSRQVFGKKGVSAALKVGKSVHNSPIIKKMNKLTRPQSPVHNV
jgi:hypothetical protein